MTTKVQIEIASYGHFSGPKYVPAFLRARVDGYQVRCIGDGKGWDCRCGGDDCGHPEAVAELLDPAILEALEHPGPRPERGAPQRGYNRGRQAPSSTG